MRVTAGCPRTRRCTIRRKRSGTGRRCSICSSARSSRSGTRRAIGGRQRRTPMGAMSDKIKGKLKKAEGRVTGDRVRETQGKLEETKGNVEGRLERTKARARMKIDEMKAKRAAKKATR